MEDSDPEEGVREPMSKKRKSGGKRFPSPDTGAHSTAYWLSMRTPFDDTDEEEEKEAKRRREMEDDF